MILFFQFVDIFADVEFVDVTGRLNYSVAFYDISIILRSISVFRQ